MSTTSSEPASLADTLVGDWPRLTRFYGLTPFELMRMPRFLTRYYAECLPELQAEETLLAFTVSDFPHYEKASREKIHRQFSRQLAEEKATIDPSTLHGQMALARLGLGVKYTKMESTPAEEPSSA